MPQTALLRRSPVPVPVLVVAAALVATLALPGSTPTADAAPAPSGPVRPSAPSAPRASALQSVRVAVPSALRAAPFDRARTLQVPEGWTVSVWARPKKARLEVATPDGRLLVSRPKYGVVTRLTPNKRGRPTSSTLIRGLRQPHGLAFDGSTLYVAESHRVDRYTYREGKVGRRTTVLSGLPDGKGKKGDLKGAYAHALKSVAVGPDHALYVSVGSTGNTTAADRTKKPQRATVLRVAKGARTATVFARGVRNGTGLAVAPDGALWTAVNNRDSVLYPYRRDYDGNGSVDYGKRITSYVNDHPVEPLARLTKGRDLGWPYCNPDPDVRAGVKGTAFAYANRGFVRDVELNPTGSGLDCGRLAPVEQGLPAHSAPLGLSFTSHALPGVGSGALVGVHGSWNRTPPRPPQVAFFPYAGAGLGAQRTILSGFQAANGSRWGRPVAAVQGRDGAVYVSDDLANAVYRLAPPA